MYAGCSSIVYILYIMCLRSDLQAVKNVGEVQETIEKLKNTISEREAYLALAHTRLSNRTRREGVELCRDELELRLYDEVTQLEHDVQSLQNMMAESMVCRRHLKQSIARIDVQLQVKQNSLHIDGELCAEQLKRINYRAFWNARRIPWKLFFSCGGNQILLRTFFSRNTFIHGSHSHIGIVYIFLYKILKLVLIVLEQTILQFIIIWLLLLYIIHIVLKYCIYYHIINTPTYYTYIITALETIPCFYRLGFLFQQSECVGVEFLVALFLYT